MPYLRRLMHIVVVAPLLQRTTGALRSVPERITTEKDRRILSIEDFGAIPDKVNTAWTFEEFEDGKEILKIDNEGIITQAQNNDIALNNTKAFNFALEEAQPGDTVLVPDGKAFTLFGGVIASEKHSITIDISGSCHFVHDRKLWPYQTVPEMDFVSKDSFDPGITIFNSTFVKMTSSSESLARAKVDYKKNKVYLVNSRVYRGGILNGNGKGWWNDVIVGRIRPGLDTRPRLLLIHESEDILVENLTLLNSPFWSLTVVANRAELRKINVLVDRGYQATLFEGLSNAEMGRRLDTLEIPFPIDDLPDWIGRKFNQPQDLNTDGIDPIGKDIWVHDCIIQNADDSVAVKPSHSGRDTSSRIPDCTTNITIENMVLTGFGASIGSVRATHNHTCLDNVTFRNISMPGTGKGIYIKSDGGDCTGATGQITNILYEDVRILSPWWWPIWIGPQQQHQPHSKLAKKCSLTWPIENKCPAPACVDFENITLRNIYIHEPLISPGVILGNGTNPMRNLVIENLQVKESKHKPWHGKWPFHEKKYPWRGVIRCKHAEGTFENSFPEPSCLKPIK